MGITLDDGEIRDFLADSTTGILTTLRSDGWPVSLPMWFVELDGAVYMRTTAGAKKIARVRRDDRAAFLVESGKRWADLRAVLLLGRLRPLGPNDERLSGRFRDAFDAKYGHLQTAVADMPSSARNHYSVPWAVLELRPTERRISWENRKLRSSRSPA